MNILEQIYEINFNKINFLERKISIDTNYTILIGPAKSGKTYLIYDYLSNYEDEDYLYIDLNDYKNDKNEIIKHLNDFIDENPIKVLVIENFEFDFELPKVQSIIISSNINKQLEKFSTLNIDPLDFEEYILFDTKHQNTTHSFNTFLKYGNLPEMHEYSDNKKTKRNYEICQLSCSDETKLQILFLLIKSAGENKSIYQLFTQLKKSIKISKDKFYKTCDEFTSNQTIFFVEKYNSPNSVKKLFVYNHALIDLVSYKKNFNNLFRNLIYLELRRKYEDIYYLDNVDFFIPNEKTIIISIPFFNSFLSGPIIKKLSPAVIKNDIKEIFIVTVSGDETTNIAGIEARVVTFHDWVLSL